jgi:hypothetical protein
VRELLCSSAYDERLYRRLGPMADEWDTMSEADRERAVAGAGDAEERLVGVFEVVDEAERSGRMPAAEGS